jgi:ubiquinone biosynthesis protein
MSIASPIHRHIRHAQRYFQILEVLARHGMADVIHELRLDSLLERGKALVTGGAPPEVLGLTRAERLRRVMEELGPTFVKLGQVLSTRPDLIPPEWAEEFKKLQDDVPAVPYEQIRALLDQEFEDGVGTVFSTISKKPLAAASIAQVHRARLRGGPRIVIKVLRPGIREVTATDMEILRTLAEFAESHFSNLGYSPTEVVSVFADELAREVDLAHEGRATDRLRAFFDDDDQIVFPKVYWEATTRNVLALEEIRGTLLSRLKPDDLPPEERRRLVENGARAVLRQTLEFGYFHADPHPGNLIALPEGRIAFIDCGMTGQLDARTTRQLANLVSGVATGDADSVIGVIADFGDVGPEKIEDRAFRADVHALVSHFDGAKLEHLDIGALLREFFDKLRAHSIRCPADLVLLIKALTTMESVGRDLDPTFEMVGFARPHLERLVSRRYSLSAIRDRFRKSMMRYAELAEDLPGELRMVLDQVRRNRVAVHLEHRGLERLTGTIEHASRNIAFALIIAAMLVGSAILVHASRSPGLAGLNAIGIAGLVVAAVLMIVMVLTNRRFKG